MNAEKMDAMDDRSENESDDQAGQVLNVEFGGRCAEDTDFHLIRTYLDQLFLKATISTSEVANQIISQNDIGCVLHQILSDCDDEDEDEDGPDDIFGVISVINITEKHDQSFVRSLKSLLLEQCTENKPKFAKELECILNDPAEQIGWLINERIGPSPRIALPTFEALWNDIEKAQRKKMKYQFTRYILIAKTTREMAHTKKKKSDTKEFTNDEDELFYENAKLTFDYSVKNQHDTVVEFGGCESQSDVVSEPLRTVILFDADKVPAIMAQMRTMLGQ